MNNSTLKSSHSFQIFLFLQKTLDRKKKFKITSSSIEPNFLCLLFLLA